MCSPTELRDTFHIFYLLLLIFRFFNFLLRPSFSETAGLWPAIGRPLKTSSWSQTAGGPSQQKGDVRKNQKELQIGFLLYSMVF